VTLTDTTERAPSSDQPQTRRRRPSLERATVLWNLERFMLLGLFAAVLVLFTVLPSTAATFPTAQNIRNVLSNESVVAILALGSMVPLVVGQFDVSVGATAGMAQIAVAATMSKHGWALVPAICSGLVIGTVVGAINGFLVAKARINALIGTLGVMTIIIGLVQLYTSGATIVTNISPNIVKLGSGTWLGIPPTTWILIGVALFVAYLLGQTPLGRHMHFVGSNPTAARLVGLRIDTIVFRAFVISGFFAGLAGALIVARNGNGDPSNGSNYLLPALTAPFLGATAIRPGRFNIPGTLLAIFFLAFTINGLNLAGVADWINNVFYGSALVIAVTLSAIVARHRAEST